VNNNIISFLEKDESIKLEPATKGTESKVKFSKSLQNTSKSIEADENCRYVI
jgi:hypothetical protein